MKTKAKNSILVGSNPQLGSFILGGDSCAIPGGKKCCGLSFAGYIHPDTKIHGYE